MVGVITDNLLRGNKMDIIVNNKNIHSILTEWGEEAWKINDIYILLEYFLYINEIILGGDILSDKLEPTCDSWFYNKESNISKINQSEKSISIAKEYIKNYIKNNGSEYYVVIIPDAFEFK